MICTPVLSVVVVGATIAVRVQMSKNDLFSKMANVFASVPRTSKEPSQTVHWQQTLAALGIWDCISCGPDPLRPEALGQQMPMKSATERLVKPFPLMSNTLMRPTTI